MQYQERSFCHSGRQPESQGESSVPSRASPTSHGCTAGPCWESVASVSAKAEGKRCRGVCGEGSPSSNSLLSGTAPSLHHIQPRPTAPHLGSETTNVCSHPSHVRALQQACATISAGVPTSTSHLRSLSSLLSLVFALLKVLHHSPSSLGLYTAEQTCTGLEGAEEGIEGWEGY